MAIEPSSRHRTFDVAHASEDVTFTLTFTRSVMRDPDDDHPVAWEERQSDSDTFRCVATAPGQSMIDLVAADAEGGGKSALALTAFLQAVITDEDWPRFDALIRDKDVQVPIDTLGAIVTWLSEEYSGRPTQPPTD